MDQDDLRWYIAVVTPNTEKACETKLIKFFSDRNGTKELEFETYVPTHRELHEWPSTGNRKWIDVVVCPCYIFIHCTEKTRYTIKSRSAFILHFLKDGASRADKALATPFATIPDIQMQNFQKMVGDAEMPVTIDASRLQIGSKVRVKSGRLKDFEGYLVRLPNGKTNLAIRLNVLGFAQTEIPAALLELVD